MKIELWPVDKPIPYARNARKLSDRAVDLVAASLKEFGWRQPVVVDRQGVVVAGHTRLLAAKKLGLKQVPVHVAKDLSEGQIKAYRLMDNRSHQEATWDEELLGPELLDLKSLGFDLDLTGFETKELDALLGAPKDDAKADACPEVPERAVSVLGDLWLCGKHRVLCGDSTVGEAVKRLFAGKKAGLIHTDPPYGIKYDSSKLHEHGVSMGRITGDEHQDDALQEFLERAFRTALTGLKENAAWYLWHAMLTQGFFAAAAAAHVCLHRQIIWVKPVLVFGRGHYHWKHELCFMGWVKGHEPPDYGDHTETTVWEAGRVSQEERNLFKHSSPKPVELFRTPIRKHLKPGEISYDPFAGTGPQFIAAEELGCLAYGMEIEPRFVDVIVQRWQTFTGQQATLEGDGKTFQQIQTQRFRKPNGKSKAKGKAA